MKLMKTKLYGHMDKTSKAKQGKAKQSKARQGKAKQSTNVSNVQQVERQMVLFSLFENWSRYYA